MLATRPPARALGLGPSVGLPPALDWLRHPGNRGSGLRSTLRAIKAGWVAPDPALVGALVMLRDSGSLSPREAPIVAAILAEAGVEDATREAGDGARVDAIREGIEDALAGRDRGRFTTSAAGADARGGPGRRRRAGRGWSAPGPPGSPAIDPDPPVVQEGGEGERPGVVQPFVAELEARDGRAVQRIPGADEPIAHRAEDPVDGRPGRGDRGQRPTAAGVERGRVVGEFGREGDDARIVDGGLPQARVADRAGAAAGDRGQRPAAAGEDRRDEDAVGVGVAADRRDGARGVDAGAVFEAAAEVGRAGDGLAVAGDDRLEPQVFRQHGVGAGIGGVDRRVAEPPDRRAGRRDGRQAPAAAGVDAVAPGCRGGIEGHGPGVADHGIPEQAAEGAPGLGDGRQCPAAAGVDGLAVVGVVPDRVEGGGAGVVEARGIGRVDQGPARVGDAGEDVVGRGRRGKGRDGERGPEGSGLYICLCDILL